jgi:glycosyltransferase involved in cell wall biosynthesis
VKVSFVIPTYNTVEWLPHSVESCLNQTYKNCEIVIVDDGSTDTTKDYLAWLNKQGYKNIIMCFGKKNMGRGAARNFGNSVAQGDVICVLDADDYNHPTRAQKTVDKIKGGAEFVYGTAEMMNVFGKKIKMLTADVFNITKMNADPLRQTGIVHSSVGYTKRISNVFPYSESREISSMGIDDWFQQVKVYNSGAKMDFISSPIVAYRSLESTVTNQRNYEDLVTLKKKLLSEIAPVLVAA